MARVCTLWLQPHEEAQSEQPATINQTPQHNIYVLQVKQYI
jgi:hypothetical protein